MDFSLFVSVGVFSLLSVGFILSLSVGFFFLSLSLSLSIGFLSLSLFVSRCFFLSLCQCFCFSLFVRRFFSLCQFFFWVFVFSLFVSFFLSLCQLFFSLVSWFFSLFVTKVFSLSLSIGFFCL